MQTFFLNFLNSYKISRGERNCSACDLFIFVCEKEQHSIHLRRSVSLSRNISFQTGEYVKSAWLSLAVLYLVTLGLKHYSVCKFIFFYEGPDIFGILSSTPKFDSRKQAKHHITVELDTVTMIWDILLCIRTIEGGQKQFAKYKI